MRGGCGYPYALRDGTTDLFGGLDTEIAAAVAQKGGVEFVSQIQALDFDMSKDFMTCEQTFWRDGDH